MLLIAGITLLTFICQKQFAMISSTRCFNLWYSSLFCLSPRLILSFFCTSVTALSSSARPILAFDILFIKKKTDDRMQFILSVSNSIFSASGKAPSRQDLSSLEQACRQFNSPLHSADFFPHCARQSITCCENFVKLELRYVFSHK